MKIEKREAIAINAGLLILFVANLITGDSKWFDFFPASIFTVKMDFMFRFIDDEINLKAKNDN